MWRSSLFRKIVLSLLASIVLLILAYNFRIAFEQRFDSYGDAREYIAIGTTLAKTGSYGLLDISNADLIEDFKSKRIGDKDYNFSHYSTWRPPVWPIIISLVFIVFGYHLTGVLVIKFAFLLLGGYFFYKILKKLGLSKITVIIGALLYLIHPASQIYSRFFLSEPITLFVLTLFIYALITFLQSKKRIWLIGILGGILILSHPYFIFLPFAIYLFLWFYKEVSFKMFVILSVLSVCIVSSWMLRNAIVLDTTKPVITTSSGAVMAKGWNYSVTSDHSNTKGDLADEALVLRDFDYDTTITRNEVEQSSLYTAAVVHFIKNNPDKILPIILTKLKSAFNPIAETSKPGFLENGRVFFHILSLLALLYTVFISKNRIGKIAAFSLIVATVSITIITYSGFRFRMPQLTIELLLLLIMFEELKNLTFRFLYKNAL